MKKILFLLTTICLLFLGQTCHAISIADGCSVAKAGFNATLSREGSGAGKEHVHVSTIPCKVYSLTVTATVNGGFAQLIEVDDAGVDQGISGATSINSGEGQQYVSEGTVKADVMVATANDTVHVKWEKGLAIGKQLFLDCSNARATVSYRE